MFIIAGTISIDPDRADDFFAAAKVMMEASNAEDGCEAYVMSQDPNDPACVRLYERWDNDDALKAHFSAPHMKEFNKALKGVVTGMDALRYDVSNVGPVR